LFVSQITQSWRGLSLVLPGVDPGHGLTVGRCLKWVKSDGLAVGQSLPVYPYQQTFSDADGMSQRCQLRKLAASFDNLIGAGEQRGWHIETERFGRF
jgi:hypothetical protein